MRQLVDDFLHKMLSTGIRKISAITLLYEETEKRLASGGGNQAVTFTRLSEISHETLRLKEVRIIRLLAMRVLTSRRRNGEIAALDADNMQNLFSEYGLLPAPGLRDCPGCYNKMHNDLCDQLKCAKTKGVDRCLDCKEYHCSISPVVNCKIEAKSILAEDVTWAVLPYVHNQYGN